MPVTATLVVRTLHVLGLALLLGGAAGVLLAVRTPKSDPLALAVGYEWLFWPVLGVMVVTGVGNLAAVGAPGPATDWGATFTAKLGLVLLFVLGSLLRTVTVVRMSGEAKGKPPLGAVRSRERALRRWTRRAYGATAGLLVVLVVLGEVLAHG